MNELISTLIGIQAMYDTGIINREQYVDNINQLCDEHGTEVVAEITVRLGLA